MELRDYQQECYDAFVSAYSRGLYRVGTSLPTGCGKSVIFSKMVADVLAKGRRVVVLVDLDALVDQTVRHLARWVPSRSIGVVKAAKNDINAPVILASIQTLRTQKRLCQIRPPALTIVDEAHVSASDTYRAYFEHVGAVPGGPGYLAGFTATWMRSDSRGLGDIWEEVVFRRSVKWAVDRGYLVEPHAVQLGGDFDLSQVRVGADGDYLKQDLEELVMVDDLRDTVVKGYHTLTPGHSAVLFAPTQKAARFFADALRDSGVRVGEILASTSTVERRYNHIGFDNGAIQVLVTCTALAKGWDSPRCDTGLMLRPTKHIGSFVQQIGRLLRPWPGKTRAWILDFVGVTDDKNMRSVVDLSLTLDDREKDDEDWTEEYVERDPVSRSSLVKRISGVHQVDLFAGTEARWLRTHHGVPFVSTAAHLYFVVPKDDGWSVGQCGTRSIRDARWVAEGLSSTEALERASDAALSDDPSIAGRSSHWRQGNQAPNEKQLRMAREIGVSTDGLTKAKLSDEISIHQASRVLANIGGSHE